MKQRKPMNILTLYKFVRDRARWWDEIRERVSGLYILRRGWTYEMQNGWRAKMSCGGPCLRAGWRRKNVPFKGLLKWGLLLLLVVFFEWSSNLFKIIIISTGEIADNKWTRSLIETGVARQLRYCEMLYENNERIGLRNQPHTRRLKRNSAGGLALLLDGAIGSQLRRMRLQLG